MAYASESAPLLKYGAKAGSTAPVAVMIEATLRSCLPLHRGELSGDEEPAAVGRGDHRLHELVGVRGEGADPGAGLGVQRGEALADQSVDAHQLATEEDGSTGGTGRHDERAVADHRVPGREGPRAEGERCGVVTLLTAGPAEPPTDVEDTVVHGQRRHLGRAGHHAVRVLGHVRRIALAEVADERAYRPGGGDLGEVVARRGAHHGEQATEVELPGGADGERLHRPVGVGGEGAQGPVGQRVCGHALTRDQRAASGRRGEVTTGDEALVRGVHRQGPHHPAGRADERRVDAARGLREATQPRPGGPAEDREVTADVDLAAGSGQGTHGVVRRSGPAGDPVAGDRVDLDQAGRGDPSEPVERPADDQSGRGERQRVDGAALDLGSEGPVHRPVAVDVCQVGAHTRGDLAEVPTDVPTALPVLHGRPNDAVHGRETRDDRAVGAVDGDAVPCGPADVVEPTAQVDPTADDLDVVDPAVGRPPVRGRRVAQRRRHRGHRGRDRGAGGPGRRDGADHGERGDRSTHQQRVLLHEEPFWSRLASARRSSGVLPWCWRADDPRRLVSDLR